MLFNIKDYRHYFSKLDVFNERSLPVHFSFDSGFSEQYFLISVFFISTFYNKNLSRDSMVVRVAMLHGHNYCGEVLV